MKIGPITVTKSDKTIDVSALIDGEQLWYRIPSGFEPVANADPFVAAAFFPAMAKGEDIELEEGITISRMFDGHLRKLQEIFKSWNPLLQYFKVHGEKSVSGTNHSGVASFFSGGVDSLHSLQKNQEEITHLIYINGFDFDISPEVFENTIAHNQYYAEYYNTTLLPVETNYFSFIKKYYVDRPLNHGSCLASVGLLLGFSKVYIPSSYTYAQAHPWGSTPLTDPMWSTEATTFVHDGAEAKRTEKIQLIAQDKKVLDHLIVCWKEPDCNCCECSKCLRTMLTLNILDLETEAFARPFARKNIRQFKVFSPNDLHYIIENLELAIEYDKPAIASELRRVIRKYKTRRILLRIEECLFRGFIKKIYCTKFRNWPDQALWLTPEGKGYFG